MTAVEKAGTAGRIAIAESGCGMKWWENTDTRKNDENDCAKVNFKKMRKKGW